MVANEWMASQPHVNNLRLIGVSYYLAFCKIKLLLLSPVIDRHLVQVDRGILV